MSTATPSEVYCRRVKEIMTRDVVTVGIEDSIHDALELMGENRVSSLPVVDQRNRCVGILSAADLIDMTRELDDDLALFDTQDMGSLRFLVARLSQGLSSESVQSFMSEDVTTVDEDMNLAIATRELIRNRFHHLPVVNHQNKLVGVVSTMDFLIEFADLADSTHPR